MGATGQTKTLTAANIVTTTALIISTPVSNVVTVLTNPLFELLLIASNEGHCLKQLRELYSNNGIYYDINYPQNLLDFAT